MSKVGRNSIVVPSGVRPTLTGAVLTIEGPKGKLSQALHQAVAVEISEGTISVKRTADTKVGRAMHGTTQRLIANMVAGVTSGFERKLIIEGVGYKANVKGKDLVLEIGYSHPVPVPIPAGVEVKAEKGLITVRGMDKQVVGQIAAIIRARRPADPYKGKGIRYEDEVIHLKPGKKAAAAGTASAQ